MHKAMATFSIAISLLSIRAVGQSYTDPAEFTRVIERVVHGAQRQIDVTEKPEIDDRSSIKIVFDQSKMQPPSPAVPDGPNEPRVNIRVQVFAIRGANRTPAAPVQNYVESVSAGTPPPGSPPGTAVTTSILNHDHLYAPGVHANVPNTEFDPGALGISDADEIEIVVTNLETREQLIVPMIPRKFGLRPKVSDVVMFVKRLSVSKADQANGIAAFNFGPSPGVTYGGTYYARKNTLVRFLEPGFGITVLFTKWDSPAFDVATGQFVAGTKSSDIQTALGGQVSLFSNVIQAGYGANLQVDQKRMYFSLGVSFVSLAGKISGLLGH